MELYGLEKQSETDVAGLLGAIKADIDEFVGDAEQFDDITIMAMKIN